MDWKDIIPHDLRAALYEGTRRKISPWRAGKLVSDLDATSFRASYRRSNGLLVAGMIVAVAGLGFFSGTMAAGAGRGSEEVASQTVCIAPTASMAAPTQEDSELSDYSFVFTKD